MVKLERLTDEQLLQVIVAESAKGINETKEALGDLEKLISRLRLIIKVQNELIERYRKEK